MHGFVPRVEGRWCPPGDHHPAAAAGDEAAQFYLGCQYYCGIDVPRTPPRLYRKAFGLNPGVLGASGYVTWRWDAREIAKAISWFRKFPEQGDPGAMEILDGLEKKAG